MTRAYEAKVGMVGKEQRWSGTGRQDSLDCICWEREHRRGKVGR
jgi:hypothetical protein